MLTIEGKMTFIKFIITFVYATMLANLVSAPLHDDIRAITFAIHQKSIYLVTTTPMIIGKRNELLEDPSFKDSLSSVPAVSTTTIDVGTPDSAVTLHHPPFGNLPIKLSPVLSLPQAMKMTMVSERFFSVLVFNITENLVIALELPNMTHRRHPASPVVDASDQVVLPKSDMVPNRSIFDTTTSMYSWMSFSTMLDDDHDAYALCPMHDVSLEQLLLHRDLHFDRSFFVSMMFLAFLSSLFEWDANAAEESNDSETAFFLLVPSPCCHELVHLCIDTEPLQSAELPTRFVVHCPRRSVTWNLNFTIHEIPVLSTQEKEERKSHCCETISKSIKDAVSTIGLLLLLVICGGV